MTDTSADDSSVERSRLSAQQAIYLFGVIRARSWRAGRAEDVGGDDVMGVRYRDLEALVRPVPYEIPTLDQARVQAHQLTVESAMRRGTVLPVPYGIVLRGRRQLIRVLQDQYLVLDEGLSLLEGHWELRLHIAPARGAEPDHEISDTAMQLYSELRRHARAAVTFAAEGASLVSAAFLVERTAWLDFMDRADELNHAHAEVSFDITGPWPPYDFVRISV
ncbi:MAG: GvpL/GvpF family gas vesicle protein [Gemmatimonadota bacterium]